MDRFEALDALGHWVGLRVAVAVMLDGVDRVVTTEGLLGPPEHGAAVGLKPDGLSA